MPVYHVTAGATKALIAADNRSQAARYAAETLLQIDVGPPLKADDAMRLRDNGTPYFDATMLTQVELPLEDPVDAVVRSFIED